MDETRVAIAATDEIYGAALAAALVSHGFSIVGIGIDDWPAETADDTDVTVFAGFEPTTKTLPSAGRSTRSVVIIEGGSEAMLDAVAAGATGVVEAEATFDEIANVIGQVAVGHAVVPPAMLGALLRSVVDRHRRERTAQRELEVLTPREREVFEQAARGRDRDGIAEALFISPATARTHLQRVFAKLGIHSKAEAVALAARCGLNLEDT